MGGYFMACTKLLGHPPKSPFFKGDLAFSEKNSYITMVRETLGL
jgi:hypothetical protein